MTGNCRTQWLTDSQTHDATQARTRRRLVAVVRVCKEERFGWDACGRGINLTEGCEGGVDLGCRSRPAGFEASSNSAVMRAWMWSAATDERSRIAARLMILTPVDACLGARDLCLPSEDNAHLVRDRKSSNADLKRVLKELRGC